MQTDKQNWDVPDHEVVSLHADNQQYTKTNSLANHNLLQQPLKKDCPKLPCGHQHNDISMTQFYVDVTLAIGGQYIS